MQAYLDAFAALARAGKIALAPDADILALAREAAEAELDGAKLADFLFRSDEVEEVFATDDELEALAELLPWSALVRAIEAEPERAELYPVFADALAPERAEPIVLAHKLARDPHDAEARARADEIELALRDELGEVTFANGFVRTAILSAGDELLGHQYERLTSTLAGRFVSDLRVKAAAEVCPEDERMTGDYGESEDPGTLIRAMIERPLRSLRRFHLNDAGTTSEISARSGRTCARSASSRSAARPSRWGSSTCRSCASSGS